MINFIMDVITYPSWDQIQAMLVKGASEGDINVLKNWQVDLCEM